MILLLCFSLCIAEGVRFSKLIRSPEDPHKVLLIGSKAKSIQEKLNVLLETQFPAYSIFTQNARAPGQHVVELSGKFHVIKKELRSKKWIDVDRATCELILIATELNHHKDIYFAFYPAHLYLNESERGPQQHIAATLRKRVGERTISTSYQLKSPSAPKFSKLILDHPMFSYRPCKQHEDPVAGEQHYTNYRADAAICQIQFDGGGFSKEELVNDMKVEGDVILDDIVPLRNPADLQHMYTRRVKVVVGDAEGYLFESDEVDGIPEQAGYVALHEIQFVLNK